MYDLQRRIFDWLIRLNGHSFAMDQDRRNQAVLEEACELVQSCGMKPAAAHAIVDYVFTRPSGNTTQEAAGLMLTLLALCEAHGFQLSTVTENELQRIERNIDEIRIKINGKPLL